MEVDEATCKIKAMKKSGSNWKWLGRMTSCLILRQILSKRSENLLFAAMECLSVMNYVKHRCKKDFLLTYNITLLATNVLLQCYLCHFFQIRCHCYMCHKFVTFIVLFFSVIGFVYTIFYYLSEIIHIIMLLLLNSHLWNTVSFPYIPITVKRQ